MYTQLPTTCAGAASADCYISKTKMAAATRATSIWSEKEAQLHFFVIKELYGRKRQNIDPFKSLSSRLQEAGCRMRDTRPSSNRADADVGRCSARQTEFIAATTSDKLFLRK